MKHWTSWIAARPGLGRVVWVLYAILFYLCGLSFTVWLLEPENLRGGLEWLGVGLFPILVPLFFVINRYLGCAGGACAFDGDEIKPPKQGASNTR